MSWKCCEFVADRCKISATEAAVLMVYANSANDQGENSYPSVAYIMHRSKLSERSVRGAISDMRKRGWLEVTEEGGGRGRHTCYKIRFDKIPAQPPWRQNPAAAAGFTAQQSLQLAHGNPAKSVSIPCKIRTPNKEEPFKEPITEPTTPAGGAAAQPGAHPLWQWMIETTTRIYEEINRVPIPWDGGRTGKELKRLFERTKRWQKIDYEKALAHYFNSDDVNPADPPEFIFKILPRYAVGALNIRHLPKDKLNGKTRTQEIGDRIDEQVRGAFRRNDNAGIGNDAESRNAYKGKAGI